MSPVHRVRAPLAEPPGQQLPGQQLPGQQLTAASPPWPIRTVYFDIASRDDESALTDVARYARSHPDRTIRIRRLPEDAVLPCNVQVVDEVPPSGDVDIVMSPMVAVVDEYRRRNTFAVLLGGAASTTIDDLIDDILPVPDQPDAATSSSSETNALPSRLQSNWARAAS
ncbi:MAG: hypothetical protein M3508_03080 [Actinomycetota bacterium]|nr:hypothetical protein [Actinomycetota bacterium]